MSAPGSTMQAPAEATWPRAGVAAALVGLSALWIGLDVAWLSADEGVQTTDAAYHLSRIAALRGKLLGLEPSGGFDGQRYGGLVYALGAWASLVVGLDPTRLLTVFSAVSRPLLVAATWRLGWELGAPGRRQATGLVAACVAPLLPGLTNYGRVVVLDGPLTVAVAWAVVFALAIVRLERAGEPRRRAAAGLALCLLLALLIKLNALAFLLGPLWIVVRPGIRRAWAGSRARLLGGLAVASLGLAALALGLLTGPRGGALRRTLVEATWPGALLFGYLPAGTVGEAPGDWVRATLAHSWEAVYFTWLQTLSPPWALGGLAALVWFFGRRRGCEDPLAHDQRDLAFWWLTPPVFAILALLRGLYDERYVLPLLPLVAALLAVGAMDLRGRWPRRTVVAIALLGGALNHGFVHHDLWPTARPLACVTVPGWGGSARVGQSLWACAAYPDYRFMDRPAAPSQGAWPVAAIEEALAPLAARAGRPLRAVFLDDLYEVFYRLFQASLLADGPLLQHEDMLLITECWDEEQMTAVFETPREVDRQIRSADVVLMRYGTPRDGDGGLRGRRCSVFWTQTVWFEDAGEVPLPDGTTVRIWSRRDP
jgi:hypothetical protein